MPFEGSGNDESLGTIPLPAIYLQNMIEFFHYSAFSSFIYPFIDSSSIVFYINKSGFQYRWFQDIN